MDMMDTVGNMVSISNGSKCVRVDFDTCPQCGLDFDLNEKNKGNAKTINHGIPLFMKPKKNVLFPLCNECHKLLNSFYKSQTIAAKDLFREVNSFSDFYEQYEHLRNEFHSKHIDRSKFGEALWDNLVKYLKYIDQKVENI